MIQIQKFQRQSTQRIFEWPIHSTKSNSEQTLTLRNFFIESTMTQLRHSKSTLNFESTFIVIQLTSVRVLIRSFKSQINSNKIINDFQNFSIKSLTINCELNEWCTMVHYIALNTTNAKSKLRDDLKLSNWNFFDPSMKIVKSEYVLIKLLMNEWDSREWVESIGIRISGFGSLARALHIRSWLGENFFSLTWWKFWNFPKFHQVSDLLQIKFWKRFWGKEIALNLLVNEKIVSGQY